MVVSGSDGELNFFWDAAQLKFAFSKVTHREYSRRWILNRSVDVYDMMTFQSSNLSLACVILSIQVPLIFMNRWFISVMELI